MVERLQRIPAKLLEMWSKYTSKQKTIILSVIAAIILALGLLYVVVTKTQYVVLQKFDSAKSASQMTDLLEEEGIAYRLSNDGTTVRVDQKKATEAIVLMDKNGLPSQGVSWLDVVDNGMSTTQWDRNTKASLAARDELRAELLRFKGVEEASINIHSTQTDNTIFADQEDAYVSVMLTLSEPMADETAQGMASWLAAAVGNSSTERVTIIDNSGKLLFSGAESTGLGGSINSVNEFKERLRNQTANNIRLLLHNMGYDEVQVGTQNMVYDMTKVNEIFTEYTVAEGREEGFYDYQYTYNTQNQNSAGGVPGTDPNADDTDYNIQDSGSANATSDSVKIKYLPNERVQNIEHEIGAFDANASTLAVVLTQYRTYDQAAVKRQGLLEGSTWEDFVDQNNVRTQITAIPQELYSIISNTTGIAEENIAISIWEQPLFNATIEEKSNLSNYLMIILAVLILALLIFVVFKGTAPVEVTEMEPELSVEQLLATTKENQSLEDIEYGETSETRKMIEKFVEENPEAVAQLLRNWLNEDWG